MFTQKCFFVVVTSVQRPKKMNALKQSLDITSFIHNTVHINSCLNCKICTYKIIILFTIYKNAFFI